MARNLVVKDNALINASYNLELVEQRLILLSIIEARATGKGITPNDKLTITASSYMNNFNTNRNTAYQALRDACNSLFERQFSYIETNAKGNMEVVRSRWVSEIRYIENEASVRLIFSPTVAPLVTLLEKNFTSYELEQVSELNSKYAVRLYEIIIAWRSQGKTPMVSVEDIRNRLGVLDNEYIELKNLKVRVIDFAIKQINEKTDILISYEQHKQGRKIVGFTFTIKQKTKKPTAKPKEQQATQTVDVFNGLTDLERQTIQQRIEEHIQRLEQQGETVGDWHRENISQKAITERWGLDVLAKEQEKEQKRQERLAKKQAEKQAKEEQERQAKERAEQRRAALIATFESLTVEQQDFILDEVYNKIKNVSVFAKMFKEHRQKNTAHTSPLFASHFYELLGL